MALDSLIEQFDTLLDVAGSVPKLRELILELAVRGRLVPQDPADEPASVLLERIEAEKRRLVKEGKIKAPKKLPPVREDEVPFEVPQGWVWVRLGNITNYGTSERAEPSSIPAETWSLDLEDIEKDTSRVIRRVSIAERPATSTKNVFHAGDVLYGKLRPYLNKIVVADAPGVCSTEIQPIRGYYGLFPDYLMLALKRPDFLRYVDSLMYGMKMPRLGTKDAQLALVPLPPQGEQQRIAVKVDELMQLCDRLEEQLVKSKKVGERWLQSIVRQVFAGDAELMEV